ncbi:insulin-like peptide INSL5 [Thalassophryne amazonica]|uniref:insulin-like peptide INSL5 n=1 Tax=Thalassophryne amazonica TaxID=390379 RepID=UPI001470C59A|nr:insulin-like peptide INSL5 [Thalassophryne amazonica]
MPAAKCLQPAVLLLVAAVCLLDAQDSIKMCGRDLIRLAVSSCGNSRVSRSVSKDNSDWHAETSIADPHTDQDQLPSESDTDNDVLSFGPHWYSLSPRMRRSTAKISDICCEKGCSMKELIQFC